MFSVLIGWWQRLIIVFRYRSLLVLEIVDICGNIFPQCMYCVWVWVWVCMRACRCFRRVVDVLVFRNDGRWLRCTWGLPGGCNDTMQCINVILLGEVFQCKFYCLEVERITVLDLHATYYIPDLDVRGLDCRIVFCLRGYWSKRAAGDSWWRKSNWRNSNRMSKYLSENVWTCVRQKVRVHPK